MKTTSEIWIDDHKAVITSITPSGQETLEVWASESAPHRNHFYVRVIAAIGDAMTILIFGPGEAKTELRKRLGPSQGGIRLHAMETVGRMTDRQIAERARDHLYT